MCQDLKQLTPVDLNKVWETEPHRFTPWLAKEENLTLLGKTLSIELELEAQEINVGDFRADLLCKNTADNSWVLIENQLEATDHRHLGQLLTYAAGLDAATVIWIAKTFRSEHAAMLDWQNQITDERYRFFGIEIKVWQIEDSAPAVQFDVVSSPNDWSRGVNQNAQRSISKQLSDVQESYLRFWTGFREYMAESDSDLRCPVPGHSSSIVFKTGRANFGIITWLRPTRNEIGIWLIVEGDNAKAHFHLLAEQKQEIHKEFCATLEWSELPERQRSRVCLTKVDTDPLDENDWTHQYEWFATHLERFNQVFLPRIAALT